MVNLYLYKGSKNFKLPEFLYNWHMGVASWSALRTGLLYPQKAFMVLVSISV
jgi:hypothetical protein